MNARPPARSPLALSTAMIMTIWLSASFDAAQASNLRFLEFSSTALFDDDDWNHLPEAARDALENNDDGAERVWENPETGNNGRIVPVRTYEDFGTTCRRLRITNNAEDRTATSMVNLCRDVEEDKWKVVN